MFQFVLVRLYSGLKTQKIMKQESLSKERLYAVILLPLMWVSICIELCTIYNILQSCFLKLNKLGTGVMYSIM